jgi:hypothetical protein
LHNNIAVGESDNETVLWRIVLVLGLGDEALTGIVIGLSNTTALVLGLVSTVVGRILDQLCERLENILKSAHILLESAAFRC